MPPSPSTYRAYFIDRDGKPLGYAPLDCADDHGAVQAALRLTHAYAIEVRHDDRLVETIPRRSNPSDQDEPTRHDT